MKYTPRHYAKAYLKALNEVSKDKREGIVDNFLKLLRRTGDIKKINLILRSIEQIYKEEHKIVDVVVKTARKLDDKFINDAIDMLLKKLEVDYTGIDKEVVVDEEILGGAVIAFDDNMVDISARYIVNQIKQKIENNN